MSGAALAVIVSGLLLAASAHAQSSSDPTLTFDPQLTGTGGSNGGGTWDTGTTANWSNGSSDVVFTAPAPGGSPAGTPDTNTANAYFDGVGGLVDVDGEVDPNELTFGGSGTYTLNPDAVNGGSINFNFPASNTGYYAGGFNGSFLSVNSGNVTFNAGININADPNGFNGYPAPGGNFTSVYGFGNYGSGNVTFNSAINFSGLDGGGEILNLFNTSTGSLLFNSTVTSSNANKLGSVNTNGTVEFNGNIGTGQLDSASGKLLLDTATGYTGLIGQSGTVLTNGALTIGTGLNQFTRGGGFGGATADVSTFESSIQNYAGTETLSAVQGGKVNFDAEVNQFGGVGTGNNLLITGAGVVSLNNAGGQTYGYRTSGSSSDVGTEIQGGTLLLMNQSGSATGDGAQGTVNNVVQIDNVTAPTSTAGIATLGGTGSTQQQVVAMGVNSVISPGDMDKNGVSTIGTLTLANGLVANNGLTMNFQLDGDNATPTPGTDNDFISLSDLTLNGVVKINFTTLDTVVTGTPYTLIAGSGTWSGTPDFEFSAPAGYALDLAYGDGTGYIFDESNVGGNTFSVQFIAVPEPSVYGLLGLGWVGLVAIGRFRRLGRE